MARLAGTILLEFGAATRKIKDTKNAPDATAVAFSASATPAHAASSAAGSYCCGPPQKSTFK